MDRRLILTGLALAVLVGAALWYALPRVQPQPPLPDHPPAVGRIALYHYWDESFARLRDALAEQGKAANAAQPGTRLVVTPVLHEAYKANAPALLAESGGNELFSWWAGWRTRDLDQRGLIAPFDAWWSTAGADARFAPAVVAGACTYRGRRCLLPLVQCYVGFFYNTAAFADAGLRPPATWTEFRAACRALRGRGLNPVALGTAARWPAQFWFDYLLLRTAGQDYRRRLLDGEASWTDPQVARAFALWRELVEDGAFNPNPNASDWLEAAKLVQTRGAAMVLMGTWVMDPFAAAGWRGGRDYGWFPFPAVDPEMAPVSLTVVDGLVLAHGPTDEAGLARVLDHLAAPETQFALAQASGNFAPHVGIAPERYDPLRRGIRESVGDRLDFPFDLATPPGIDAAGLEAMTAFLDRPAEAAAILAATQARMAALWTGRRGAAQAGKP